MDSSKSSTLMASCMRPVIRTSVISTAVYVCCPAELATDISVCQYRRMSKSLILLEPADTVACCSPLSAQPLSQAQAEQVAPLLKALADPVRLRLMSLVASHPGGEACVCDLNDAF